MFNQDPEKKQPKGKKQFKFKLKINLWTVAIAVLLIFFVVPAIIAALQNSGSSNKENVSQVLTDIKAGKVGKVSVDGVNLTVTYKDGSTKTSTKEDTESF